MPRTAATAGIGFAVIATLVGLARPAAAQTPDVCAPSVASSSPPPDARFAALPVLTWRSTNTHESYRTALYRPDGTVDPDAVRALAHLLRDLQTSESSPVITRTLRLLVKIANHFHATDIAVISGFRSGRDAQGHRIRREGYHSVGSAVDFQLPGEDMRTVAAYARTLPHVGVGWYPTSQFVHLDSRQDTYVWENRASHGHHGWDRPLDRTGCPERDAQWAAAQDVPWDLPGAPAPIVLHPRTAAGAHPPRHASRGHHANHHAAHGHAPLQPFRAD